MINGKGKKEMEKKTAATAALAVLVIAGLIFGTAACSKATEENGDSQNVSSSIGTSEETVADTREGYGEEDFADLLSAEPTPLSSFEIGENDVLKSFVGSEETVVIPDSITEIGDYAFQERSIKRVYISGNVKSIGAYAFENCPLLEEVYMADGVTYFGSAVFMNDSSLKMVRLPKTWESNPDHTDGSTFRGCGSLEYITIPDTFSAVGACWFMDTGLKKIEIPSSVERIGTSTFCGCSSLSEVVLNEGIKYLDFGSFSGCISLKEITIPNSVSDFQYAFNDCGAKLLVHKGSEAEQIAIEKKMNYEVID